MGKPTMFNCLIKKIKIMFKTNQQSFEKLWENAFTDWPFSLTTEELEVRYDSEKTDDGYVLEIPVPGLTKKDLKVKIVKGKLNVINNEKSNKWVPSFEKVFTLPDDSDIKNIKASVEDGILIIKIGIKEDSENIINVI